MNLFETTQNITLRGLLHILPKLTLASHQLNFVPDEVIIKHISLYDVVNSNIGTGIYNIISDITTTIVTTIAVVPSLCKLDDDTKENNYYTCVNVSPNISIQLKNGLNGGMILEFENPINGVVSGGVAVTLEFRKYYKK